MFFNRGSTQLLMEFNLVSGLKPPHFMARLVRALNRLKNEREKILHYLLTIDTVQF